MSGVDPRILALGLKPKALAALEQVGADPEFGNILAVGMPSNAAWLILFMIPLTAAGFAIAAFSPGYGPSAPGPDIVGGVILLAIALVSSIVIWWLATGRGARFRFFEHGATLHRRGKDRQRLAYLEVVALTYRLTRQYYEGIYIGTSGKVKLDTEKGSSIKGMNYQFRHREKSRGFFKRTFEGVDPMDLVRDAIAESVAEKLAADIAEKGSVPWTGSASFTREGLAVKKLLGGLTVLPYDTIDRYVAKAGAFSLFQRGENKAVATLAINGKNFYPGMVLMGRLVTPAAPDPQPAEHRSYGG